MDLVELDQKAKGYAKEYSSVFSYVLLYYYATMVCTTILLCYYGMYYYATIVCTTWSTMVCTAWSIV